MQIKTFQAGEDHEINQWLDNNYGINIHYINRIPMHDLGHDGHILNQWIDVVIVYTINGRPKR